MVGALVEGCDLTKVAFVRAAELPAVETVTPVRDKSLRSAGIAAMRALPSWKTLQKSYVAEHGKGAVVFQGQPTPRSPLSAGIYQRCRRRW